MAKVKAKRGHNLPVPQSREEAAAHIRTIGDTTRAIARIEADMNDALARIKEEAEAKAAPFRDLVGRLTEGVRIWCDANRDALTDSGKRKFADLGTGKVEWRNLPPKVTIKGVEAVIGAIKTLGLSSFLRTKEEIDKEAMLREPDKARLVQGVSIGSEGETFAVEPFEAQIEGAAS